MGIGAWAVVEATEVYVSITHTYIGDLLVKLRSPQGTEITLHNRTGGGTDNLIGWYPSQLTPHQSLNAFVGQATDGTWTLTVSDQAGGDTGMLNSWCLRITYGGNPAATPEVRLPAVLALRAPACGRESAGFPRRGRRSPSRGAAFGEGGA